MRALFAAALILFDLLAGAGSASAGLGPVIATYGNWDIRRDQDMMTDRVTCVATYKNNANVQLGGSGLHVKVSKNPLGYLYRIDDEPVRARHTFRGDLMRRVGLITFAGSVFGRLLNANRLRLQVVGRRRTQEFDLKLDGINNAYSAVYYCR